MDVSENQTRILDVIDEAVGLFDHLFENIVRVAQSDYAKSFCRINFEGIAPIDGKHLQPHQLEALKRLSGLLSTAKEASMSIRNQLGVCNHAEDLQESDLNAKLEFMRLRLVEMTRSERRDARKIYALQEFLVNELNRSEELERQLRDKEAELVQASAELKRRTPTPRLSSSSISAAVATASSTSSSTEDAIQVRSSEESELSKSDIIGKYIRKAFGSSHYFGIVISYDSPYFKVVYEDADVEEITRSSFQRYYWTSAVPSAKISQCRKHAMAVVGRMSSKLTRPFRVLMEKEAQRCSGEESPAGGDEREESSDENCNCTDVEEVKPLAVPPAMTAVATVKPYVPPPMAPQRHNNNISEDVPLVRFRHHEKGLLFHDGFRLTKPDVAVADKKKGPAKNGLRKSSCEVDDNEPLDVLLSKPSVSFELIWPKLVQVGWTWNYAQTGWTRRYFRPNVAQHDVSQLVRDVDYFENPNDLIASLRKHRKQGQSPQQQQQQQQHDPKQDKTLGFCSKSDEGSRKFSRINDISAIPSAPSILPSRDDSSSCLSQSSRTTAETDSSLASSKSPGVHINQANGTTSPIPRNSFALPERNGTTDSVLITNGQSNRKISELSSANLLLSSSKRQRLLDGTERQVGSSGSPSSVRVDVETAFGLRGMQPTVLQEDIMSDSSCELVAIVEKGSSKKGK